MKAMNPVFDHKPQVAPASGKDVRGDEEGLESLARRKAVLAGAGTAAALLLALLPAMPAAAHHSWNASETRYAYYVTGTVTYVRWGNPHCQVRLRVEKGAAVPADWAQRPLPPGADETDGHATMVSARPYNGEYQELMLTLAPPDWMEKWGMNRELKVGEHIEAAGFLDVGGGDGLRPVMFWMAGGQGVWQKLTAFPHLPEPAPAKSN
jgi:hypothetical protein